MSSKENKKHEHSRHSKHSRDKSHVTRNSHSQYSQQSHSQKSRSQQPNSQNSQQSRSQQPNSQNSQQSRSQQPNSQNSQQSRSQQSHLQQPDSHNSHNSQQPDLHNSQPDSHNSQPDSHNSQPDSHNSQPHSQQSFSQQSRSQQSHLQQPNSKQLYSHNSQQPHSQQSFSQQSQQPHTYNSQQSQKREKHETRKKEKRQAREQSSSGSRKPSTSAVETPGQLQQASLPASTLRNAMAPPFISSAATVNQPKVLERIDSLNIRIANIEGSIRNIDSRNLNSDKNAKSVDERLAKLETLTSSIHKMLKALTDRQLPQARARPAYLPFGTSADIVAFNHVDEEEYGKMVNYLSSLGGANKTDVAAKFFRNCIKVDEDIFRHVTWCSSKNTLALKETRFAKACEDAMPIDEKTLAKPKADVFSWAMSKALKSAKESSRRTLKRPAPAAETPEDRLVGEPEVQRRRLVLASELPLDDVESVRPTGQERPPARVIEEPEDTTDHEQEAGSVNGSYHSENGSYVSDSGDETISYRNNDEHDSSSNDEEEQDNKKGLNSEEDWFE